MKSLVDIITDSVENRRFIENRKLNLEEALSGILEN